MRLPASLAALIAVAFASSLHAGGTIEGHVELPKTRVAPVMNKRYEVVTRGGAIAVSPPQAVVYLEGSFPQGKPVETPQVEQKDMTFVPLLLAVRAGTRVEFPNLDDTAHNIFSYSPAKRFDLGRYRADEHPIPGVVFDQPGLVTLRCDIHEHMRGLILVVPTPYFVKTDAAGNFQLTGLPVGKFLLKAWLDSRKTLEQPVEITEGATLHVNFP